MNLYNPNSQLFISVVLSTEFLAMGHLVPRAQIHPIDLRSLSFFYVLTSIIYLVFVIDLMLEEIQQIFYLKRRYFHQVWSYLQWSIIVCSWSAFGCYFWRQHKIQHITKYFHQTHGYAFVSLQFVTLINQTFDHFLILCCFFNLLNLLRFARYTRRLAIYGQTLRHALKDLLHYALMYSLVFIAFVSLFYLLFVSQSVSTAEMLIKILLLKHDVENLSTADRSLGPFCLALFIILMIFVGLTMFLSIINASFSTCSTK